eukprot:1161107-Pleurochrysis_carterae.AAC.2
MHSLELPAHVGNEYQQARHYNDDRRRHHSDDHREFLQHRQQHAFHSHLPQHAPQYPSPQHAPQWYPPQHAAPNPPHVPQHTLPHSSQHACYRDGYAVGACGRPYEYGSPRRTQHAPMFSAPTPPHVREGMEAAALQARALARRQAEEERLAALQYKLSKYA